MFAASFFVATGALARPDKTELSDADLLKAFDAARRSIFDVVREVYSYGCRSAYTLIAADFR